MNTYCIGDVQGCYDELVALLDSVNFDPASDELVLLGDIINRGPKSLQTLRFAKSLGDSCRAVLGNHDLSVLAKIHTRPIEAKNKTMRQIIGASDAEELLTWLRSQPLALQFSDEHESVLMIHAGVPPQWSIAQTLQYAAEVESALRGDNFSDFFDGMFGDEPQFWSSTLSGIERLRFITNCLTRLRYCDSEGRLALHIKSEDGRHINTGTKPLLPWFAVPQRASADQLILFGHWSQLSQVFWPQYRVWGMDTGCVWGGRLSALHLQSRRLIQAPLQA
ncbi:MAG: symmetrical bis(5'-nucleosyl)-tetraphosphatase [Oceanococcus sp.]